VFMEIKGASILVTGGLGFIGSHIVNSLVSQRAKVRILDNYSTGSEENISAVKDRVEIIKGDILDLQTLRQAIRGADIVSHHAAQLEITKAIADPVGDLTTNTTGTLNLFQACAELGVKRIVNASSAGVYGEAVEIPQKEDNHPTNPNWAYGVGKLANEKYSMIMKELYGLEITNFRYAIVYGPREWYGRVLTIFLKRALEDQPLIVFGDGEQIRDFIYVDDVVEMHNQCLLHEEARHQIFNVSTEIGTTINSLAQLVLTISGKDLKIVHEEVPEGNKSKQFERKRLPQELKTLIQSRQKAKELVGWEPKISLEEGVKKEWKWLVSNPHRWQTMSY